MKITKQQRLDSIIALLFIRYQKSCSEVERLKAKNYPNEHEYANLVHYDALMGEQYYLLIHLIPHASVERRKKIAEVASELIIKKKDLAKKDLDKADFL